MTKPAMTDQDRLRALEAENHELREWRAGQERILRALMDPIESIFPRPPKAIARIEAWRERVTVLEAALRQLRGDMRQRSADTKVVRDEEPDALYTPAVFTAFIEELDKWTNDIATLLHPEGSPAPDGR